MNNFTVNEENLASSSFDLDCFFQPKELSFLSLGKYILFFLCIFLIPAACLLLLYSLTFLAVKIFDFTKIKLTYLFEAKTNFEFKKVNYFDAKKLKENNLVNDEIKLFINDKLPTYEEVNSDLPRFKEAQASFQNKMI